MIGIICKQSGCQFHIIYFKARSYTQLSSIFLLFHNSLAVPSITMVPFSLFFFFHGLVLLAVFNYSFLEPQFFFYFWSTQLCFNHTIQMPTVLLFYCGIINHSEICGERLPAFMLMGFRWDCAPQCLKSQLGKVNGQCLESAGGFFTQDEMTHWLGS